MQLLDDIFINKDIKRSEIIKRMMKVIIPCLIIGLTIRFFTRSIILQEIHWLADFILIVPLMQGFLISLALGYYCFHYGEKSWADFKKYLLMQINKGIREKRYLKKPSFLMSFVVFAAIYIPMTLFFLRSTICGFFSIIMLMLDITREQNVHLLFYLNNFWIDILSMIIDILIVFYIYSPVSKSKT